MLTLQFVEFVTLELPVIPLQSDDNPFIMILFLSVFGIVAIYGGWKQYRTRQLIQDTPTEKVRSMAAGRTELKGRAWAVEEPFDAPFGDGEAVVGSWKIEEWEKTGEDDYDWVTKDSGDLLAPFVLEDDTGEALVDADDGIDLRISDANRTRYKVGKTEEEPPVVKDFLRTHSDLGVPDSGLSGVVFGEKRRYTQEIIPPGESVYVFGGAHTREGGEGSNADRLVIGEDDMSERFFVSDKSEDALASGLGKKALLIMGLGVVLLTAAFYIIVTEFGLAG